jgi:predicted membrane protein
MSKLIQILYTLSLLVSLVIANLLAFSHNEYVTVVIVINAVISVSVIEAIVKAWQKAKQKNYGDRAI